MNRRNLLVVVALAAAAAYVSTNPASAARRQVGRWAPEPGWQIVEDRPAGPDLLVVGIFGEPYIDPWLSPPARAAAERQAARNVSSDRMPRLALRCENGATSLTVFRALRNTDAASSLVVSRPRRPGETGSGVAPRGVGSATADPFAGKLVVMFTEEQRIEIDLADYPVRTEPILVSEPYDRIGELRRHETAYFFEIQHGEAVWVGFGSEAWGAEVDAVFPLDGLDDLLRATRDPCAWRAS